MSAEPQSVSRGETKQFGETFATSIVRLIILVNPCPNGMVTVTLSQGGVSLSSDIYTGDTEIVYDVVP